MNLSTCSAFCLAISIILLVAGKTATAGIMLKDEPTCRDFVMNSEGNITDKYYKNWLLGFLSGVAFCSGRDFLRDVPVSSIYHHVHLYCNSYPESNISEAAAAYVERSAKEVGG